MRISIKILYISRLFKLYQYHLFFIFTVYSAAYINLLQEKVQEKVGLCSTAESGKGKSKMSKNITHGYHLVKGKAHHPMEDYVFAEFKQVGDSELGLLAIFDGHLSHVIPDYLKSHLFDNILNEVMCNGCILSYILLELQCVCSLTYNKSYYIAVS